MTTTDLISKGRHPAICRSIQLGKAKPNTPDEKKQVVVEFELTDQNDPYVGRSITWFGFFTDGTFDKTIEALTNMGWTGDDLSELPVIAHTLTTEVSLVIDHEEWEGQWQARVRWVNRAGGGVLLKAPLVGAELDVFATQMKSRIRAARGGSGSRPTNAPTQRSAPARHPNAPGADDPLPF